MSEYTAWNSESLLVEWDINRASIIRLARDQREIEAELKRRMLADGAKVIPDPLYICELKTSALHKLPVETWVSIRRKGVRTTR